MPSTQNAGLPLPNTTESITLEWEATDVDDDIQDYEIFLAINQESFNRWEFPNTNFDIDVTSGNNYTWYVKTNDTQNNSSNSENFEPRVEKKNTQ